jgi:O-antigen/teichoic acid export membrane protein
MTANPSALIDRLPALLRGRIRHFRQHAARRSFTWNVLIMLAGTVAGQAVSLLLAPVLTRIYSPTEFGYLSVYTAVLSIFGVVASLGLDMAIPICMADDECADLLALNGLALAGTTGVAALFAWLAPAHIFHVLSVGSLANYRWLLPVGFAGLGAFYIMVAVATRAGAFNDIARTRMAQGVSGPVSQVLLGLAGAGAPGLALGYVIGQFSGAVPLFGQFVLRQRTWLEAITWRGIAAIARRYVSFPLLAGWARVLDMAGGGMVLFVVVSACYSPDIAGFMFLSDRVVARPLLIVSTSLLQVFTGEAGRAISQNPVLLRRRFYQVVSRQFLIVAAWVVVANLLAAWAFPLLFGAQWASAVPYLRALSLSYLMLSVLHAVSSTLQLLERQVAAMVWQLCRLALIVAGVLLARHAGFSAIGALWICSAVQAVCCLVMLVLMVGSIEQMVARRGDRTIRS